MRPRLNDLRLLRLAAMYEHAFEAFIVELAARDVEDDEVLALLGQLTAPDEHSDRISHEMARLGAGITARDRWDVERAALLDVCEVERTAQEFYLQHADRVHDPGVAALFRELAQEEGRHHRIARRALALHEEKAARRRAADRRGREEREGAGSEVRLLGPGERLPLWEGVSDYGR